MKQDQWLIIGMVTAVSVSVLTILGNLLLWADFQSMEGLVPTMENTSPVLVAGLVTAILVTVAGYTGREDTAMIGLTIIALSFISAFSVNWLETGGLGGLDTVLYGMGIVAAIQVGGLLLEDPDMVEMHI